MADDDKTYQVTFGDSGYPKGKSQYIRPEETEIKISDHFLKSVTPIKYPTKKTKFRHSIDSHFVRDVNDPNSKYHDLPVTHTDEIDGSVTPVFSGSSTNINPLNNEIITDITENGLETYEQTRINKNNGDESNTDGSIPSTPISPLHPFMRSDPKTVHTAVMSTYNRTKLPILDLEFRKGFRHMFMNRPECYIMAHDTNGSGIVLSEQAQYDDDFASSYSRFPHISKLLSPIYVTGSFSQNNINSNWNYLLSNRIISVSSTPGTVITTEESPIKSIEGHFISIGNLLTSNIGSTVEIKFQETKYLEVYEMLRLWMLYIYKTHKGIFAPSFNGYQYKNEFLTINGDSLKVYQNLNGDRICPIIYHVYDRALDYTCSLFDVFTDESMNKILYWTKYTGMFPIEVSIDSMSSTINTPQTESLTVSAKFVYQEKVENRNKSLVEFNYNAGITDNVGRINKTLEASYPFLLQDDENNTFIKHYIGAAGMFTGSPYIVLGETGQNPLDSSEQLLVPFLRFMPLNAGKLNSQLNLGLENRKSETDTIIGVLDT